MLFKVMVRVGYGQVCLLVTGNAEYASIMVRQLRKKRNHAYVARAVVR